MRRMRYALLIMVLALAMGLAVTWVFADSGTGAYDAESAREMDAALAAEANPQPASDIPAFDPTGITYPLFMGVDDATVPAYTMDPTTNISVTAFIGFQVWGSAYDSVNDLMYFNNGSTLYSWPVGSGTINTLGTIVDPVGATQSMVGLAFYNGQLYGVKNIANEAIWAIDTNTLVATVFIDYADADFDLGGFAADPNTGEFYATNDDTTPNGSGLFRINPDGSGTLIAPYPAGQTDIDGLAVSDDGYAYLVIDEPGFIYVYDLVGNAYTTPLDNPWTSSEVFSGGAYIVQPSGAAISLNKTVGTDPGVCAVTDTIDVPAGTEVTYCYEVTNTGTATLNYHDLDDSELGNIFSGLPYALIPGASAFITQSVTINATTVNTGTWTAYNPLCSTPNVAIPDNNLDGVTDTLAVNLTGSISDLNVDVDVLHTWVGDVSLTLTHVDTGTSATIIDRPGVPASTFGCAGNDIAATLDDEAATLVEDECGAGVPAIAGSFIPNNPLSVFDGEDLSGTWTMVATDAAGGDTGTLVQWCLQAEGLSEVATASDTATVNVLSNEPDIVVDPTSMSSTQPPDTTVTQPLDINNVGGATLDWNIDEANVAQFNGPFVNNPLSASEEVGSAGAGSSNPAPLSGFEWPEAVLWDNGPLVTHPGGGAGGADESRLQNSSLLMTTLGFGHQVLNNNWVADDFVVSDAAGWTVDAATFFAYQTGSTTTSTMTNVNWILYDGDPSGGGAVITSGSGLQTSIWSNIYRATETTIGATDRPIMATTVNMGGLFLPAGTYWLAWQTAGTLASGPWAPPITIIGQTTTGNGLQSLAGTASFAPANDGGTLTQQGFPFILEGSVGGGGGGGCDTPSDIPWLSLNPTAGSTAAGGTTTVDVTYDSTGYAAGTYSGLLCVNSNDPDTPLVEVPVEMIVEGGGTNPAIVMTKTVGTTAGVCATTDNITVSTGTQVYYCYVAENTGDVTFNFHDLVDSELGILLDNFNFVLPPGGVSPEVIVPAVINAPTVNTATWTAVTSIGGYTYDDTINYNFEDIAATGTAFILGDDEVSGPLPIGFSFDFYGVTYTDIRASSNGFLTVNNDTNSGCCTGQALPTPGSPDGLIAGWWEDMDPGEAGSGLYYETLGTAPNRYMIVQYTNVQHYPSGTPVTLQYKLYEGSDVIEVHYLDAPSDGGTHSAGLENQDGTVGIQYFLGTTGLPALSAVRYTPEVAQSASASDTATVQIADPDIVVNPTSLASTQDPDTQVTLPLDISNVGTADLTWTIDEAAPALPVSVSVPVATGGQTVTIGDGVISRHPDAKPGVPNSATPVVERPAGLTTITHSVSQTIVQFNSVSCNAGGLHTDNSYLRYFTLSDFGITADFEVVEVEIGIETATGATGSQPAEMRLYTWDPNTSFTFANLTPIGSANVTVADQGLTILTVPVSGVVPAGGTLVVEFFTPNGQTAGNSLFVGSNNLGQTGLTYLAAADCGITEPTDTGTVGFPDMHLVMNVTGQSTGPCSAPSDIPWLSLNPTAGTTAPGGTTTVDVTFDSTGYTTGTYTGTLCVNSNDPDTPLVEVPVEMTVQGEVPVASIALTKTVGLDPMTCATTSNLVVGQPSTVVYYCYTVSNTGNVTLTVHDLLDDQLGTIFTGFAYDLAPGASVDTVAAGLTISTTVTGTVTNVGTWTAYVPGGPSATATATATVTEQPTDVSLSGFGGEAQLALQPVLLAALLILTLGLAALWRRKAAEG
ncbi:MAG: hypothetical protein H6666_00590 [Ardenticatenaceae bacterium]|nr:hypothetical protein [Ardenticatenaceae bacterium]